MEVPRNDTRLHAFAAVFGGLLWFLPSVLSSLGVPLFDAVRLETVFALAPPFLVIGIWGFYREFAPTYSTYGRAGLWALAIGVVALWPLSLLHLVASYVSIPIDIGLLLLIVADFVYLPAIPLGAIGFGIDCWSTATPSRRMALWFPLAIPASVALNLLAGGELLYLGGHLYAGFWGLAWVGFGYVLWRTANSR